MKVYEIKKAEKKQLICREILTALPEWFGIEEAREKYIEEVRNYPFFAMKISNEYVGFMSILQHNDQVMELYVLGVHPSYHRQKVGENLFVHVKKYARNQSIKLLTVKTLAALHPSLEYAQTRLFYEKMGFFEIEIFSDLWGKENPCLYMGYII